MDDNLEYPQCFIIRSIDTEEATWFVVIEDKTDDLELLTYQSNYLTAKYIVDQTTLSEAETYSAFGIAPLGTCSEFKKWLNDIINNDIATVGNIITGDKHFSKDDYPSYYAVFKIENNDPVCVFPIKSKEQNIEMSISWWKKFSNVAFIEKVDYNSFESYITVTRMLEYNIKELLDRVEKLTKKGA